MSLARRHELALALAAAFSRCEWTRRGLLAAAAGVVGARSRRLGVVADGVLAAYREPPLDRPRELTALVELLLEELERGEPPPRLPQRVAIGRFGQAPARSPWPVPAIATPAELAAFLDLHPGELRWLADVRGWERTAADERLRNYRYAWLPRASAPPRLVERPKRLLKEVQRRVLHSILDAVPPHETAHGFRRGHSVVTHARRHTQSRVLLRFDLEDFFASVAAGRVYGIFRRAGYPEPVAHLLTGLCTNGVPPEVAAAAPPRVRARLAAPHLPQGAPTSPALANLACFGLDRRLAGLAARTGAVYSRYADDLALSGGSWLLEHAGEVRALVGEIVRDEGFRPNERKAALATRAGPQRICGVVVNEHPNVARADFDRLKATLHRAATRGPADPALRAHLRGRVAWVESVNPPRGAKLRRLYERIVWA